MRRQFLWGRSLSGIVIASACVAACATRPSPTRALLTATAARSAGVDSSQPKGIVRGILFDSLMTMDVMRGALVTLDNTVGVTGTSDLGSFTFDSAHTGPRRLLIRHPLLDSLGIDTISVPFVARETAIPIVVALPSPKAYVDMRCKGVRGRTGDGMVIGVVRNSRTDAPIAGTRVAAAWRGTDTTFAGDGLRERGRVVTSVTGQFVLCRVPRFTPIELWAVDGLAGTARLRVQLGAAIFGAYDISVDTARTAGVDRVAGAGAGSIRGRIITAVGDGLPNAIVKLDAPSLTTTTDSSGVFQFADVPSGVRAIEIRAIGFRPSKLGINIRPAQRVDREITLNRTVAVLGTVTVRATTAATWDSVGFEERRKRGSGYFMTQQALTGISDLGTALRMVPGIRGRSNERVQRLIAGRGAGCYPAFVVNGVRFDPGGFNGPESMINPDAVRAIEVYGSRLSTPPQYQIFGDCAVIVIWLRDPQREREAAARAKPPTSQKP